MKVVIIDDEKKSAFSLAYSLENCGRRIEVIKMYQDPAIALREIENLDFELLLLDISMPKMNGFELLEKLDNISFHVIFVTAFDNYAIEAFKVGAIDYLLKPIDEEQLKSSLKKLDSKPILSKYHIETTKSIYDQLREPKISIGTQKGLEIISIKNIIRCEADGSYTTIFCKDEKVVVTKTLKQIESVLAPFPFFRIHNSNLVNLNYVKRYHKGTGGMVELENGDKVVVSRYKKKEFLEVLLNFFG